MDYKYKFSVIVPVYNAEIYLDDALKSVINQTVGFEENIQLIIVNDGSTDNSADICIRYREKYPDNIVYIEKENGGVSSARNEGIEHIKGRYTVFLDADDKWNISAFAKAYDYFEKHYDEIDMLSCRVERFDAKNGYNSLDYKFKAGTRIADINKPAEYFSVQALVTSVLIKTEAIGNVRFDPRIICGEDTVFCVMIISKKCKIGFIKEALYYYRVRAAQNSTMDTIRSNRFYYDEMLDYYHQGLLNYSKEKFGKVIPYIQATVTNELMWRFENSETTEMLSDEEFAVYKKRLKDILSQIEENIIFSFPIHKAYARRATAANLKYGIDYYKSITLDGNKLYFRKYEAFDMASHNTLCMLNSLSADKKSLRIEILVANWLLRSTESGGRLALKAGERFINPKEMLEYAQRTVRTFEGGEYYYSSCIFNFKLKMKEGESVQLTPFLIYGDKKSPVCLNCTRAAQGVALYTTCRLQGKYVISYEDDAIQISAK